MEIESFIKYATDIGARLHGVTAVMDITNEAEKAWKSEPWG